MPVQDFLGAGPYKEGFARLDAAFDAEPTATYRKLRDMFLKSEFRRSEAETLPSPWREYCLASLAWGAGRELEALTLLDSVGKGRFYFFRYYVAEILLRRLDLYKLARTEIQAVAVKCPWLWEARCLWAENLMALGHADPLKVVRGTVSVPESGKSAFLAWRGALELWWGEYDAAVKDLDTAAALDNPDALCWRGGALCRLGRLQESKRDLDRLLTIDPHDPEGLAWRGELRRLLGDRKGARKDLDDLISISGTKPWALVNRALLSLEENDLDGAWRDFHSLYLNHGAAADAPRPFSPADLKSSLENLLRLGRGCRRSDPHLNAGWMHAAGIPQPERHVGGAKLNAWAAWAGLRFSPEPPPPDAPTEAEARAVLTGHPAA